MLDRRALFGTAAATSTFLSFLLGSRRSNAAVHAPITFEDVEERGTKGRLERLPTLDLESSQDFLTGFRNFVNRDMRRLRPSVLRKYLRRMGISLMRTCH